MLKIPEHYIRTLDRLLDCLELRMSDETMTAEQLIQLSAAMCNIITLYLRVVAQNQSVARGHWGSGNS